MTYNQAPKMAEPYTVGGMMNKPINIEAIEKTGHVLFGIPIYESSTLKEGECVVVKNGKAVDLVNYLNDYNDLKKQNAALLQANKDLRTEVERLEKIEKAAWELTKVTPAFILEESRELWSNTNVNLALKARKAVVEALAEKDSSNE